MSNFLVVRHAQDMKKDSSMEFVHGSVNTPLAPEGYDQARDVAARLAKYSVDTVHASPLLRTLDTARIICEYTSAKLVVDRAMIGRNMGSFALGGNRSMAAASQEVITTQKGTRYYVNPQGAEALDVFYDRINNTYASLREQYADSDSSVVLVTHHLAGTLFRGAHDHLLLHDALEYEDLAHDDIVELVPGGLSKKA